MKQEKEFFPISGYLMVTVFFILLVFGIYFIISMPNPVFIAIFIVAELLIALGFLIIYPNFSSVLTLFGSYKGTIKKNGFHWVNPLFFRKKISLRAQNFDSEKIKVNDKLGNPIQISVILVWRVENTFKAAFEVNDHEHFVRVQSDAAVRKLAGSYPYDNFDDEQAEITLRSGLSDVNHALEAELSERLNIAGIRVIEARIGYLAYAPEIASAMLRRQQATAIVAARLKIVEGAVGMVEMAIDELSRKQVIDLDEERKATMVSNLMVVLCADKDVSPVINTGTLHQ
ncbi:MAG: SPFH domain-containing protein [Cyclobacteriaceae bacterium]|nr:SPFH domain-containing protein [Cyclobacteriaceae bacterium]